MAYGGDGLFRGCKMTNDLQYTRIQAQVFGRAATRNDQGVVVFGFGVLEGGVESKVMAALFGVGLVAFEIVDGGAYGFAGRLAGADSIHRVTDHQEGLERNHDFVVFDVIADDHEDFLFGHWGLLEGSG